MKFTMKTPRFLFYFLGLTLLSASFVHADESAFLSMDDGVKLSAQWDVPAGTADANVKKAFLILQGSGNVGKDGDVSSPLIGQGYLGKPAKLSDQIAAVLDSAGFASLRYDKRGFDDASQLGHQIFPYLVKDAQSALSALHARFPQAELGMVGFSEGALVAVFAAAETESVPRVSSLYLLSLPTRSIDESLAYEYVQWPVDLLKRKLGVSANGELLPPTFDFLLPLLGVDWKGMDRGHTGRLSLASEVLPAYLNRYASILKLLETPAYSGWYNSLKVAPPFSEAAGKITAKVYLYEPLEDAQNDWSWVVTDQSFFTANQGQTTLETFPGLGHCFSPMDGEIGQIKTSGPLSPSVLEALGRDVL